MGTYTTNLSLFKPTKGDSGAIDDFVDVAADVNTNMDIIDTNIGMRLVTSGNLPSSPYTGMLVLETDTGFVRVWTGSVWDLHGKDGSSIGRVGYSLLTADGAALTSASAETQFTAITFTAVSDRRYCIEFEALVNLSAGAVPGNGKLRVRAAAGATVANTDTQIGSDVFANVVTGLGVTNGEWCSGSYHIVPGINGNYTVGLFFIVTSAGDTMNVRANGTNQKAKFLVRDIGV